MEIQNPHDKFFKAIISQIKYARELISIKLPEGMKAQLDWEGLHQEPGSFIDEKYKESFTDALFSIPYKKKEVLIGILVEHKSHPDPKVFSQLLRYQRQTSDEACRRGFMPRRWRMLSWALCPLGKVSLAGTLPTRARGPTKCRLHRKSVISILSLRLP